MADRRKFSKGCAWLPGVIPACNKKKPINDTINYQQQQFCPGTFKLAFVLFSDSWDVISEQSC